MRIWNVVDELIIAMSNRFGSACVARRCQGNRGCQDNRDDAGLFDVDKSGCDAACAWRALTEDGGDIGATLRVSDAPNQPPGLVV